MKHGQKIKRKPKISWFLRSFKQEGQEKAGARRILRGNSEQPNSTKVGAGESRGRLTGRKNKHRESKSCYQEQSQN